MMKTVLIQGMDQAFQDILLTDHLFKTSGTPLPGKHLISHKSPDLKNKKRPSSRTSAHAPSLPLLPSGPGGVCKESLRGDPMIAGGDYKDLFFEHNGRDASAVRDETISLLEFSH